MLAEIKHYVFSYSEHFVSLSDLANHFDVERDRMKFMLSHFIRKGKISKQTSLGCGSSEGCNGCSTSQEEYYCWAKVRPAKIASVCIPSNTGKC